MTDQEVAAKAVAEAAATLTNALNRYPGILDVRVSCIDATTVSGPMRRVYSFEIKEEKVTEIYP